MNSFFNSFSKKITGFGVARAPVVLLLDAVRILFAKLAVVSDLECVFITIRKNNLASFWGYVDMLSRVDVVAHHVEFFLQGIDVAKRFFLAFGAESSLFAIPCVAECVCHRVILFFCLRV
jgi:hypothetical protein